MLLNIEEEKVQENNIIIEKLLLDIKYNFQLPTYLLEKDDNVLVYNCDRTKELCKVNLDLRNSFD
jgi:hypothetical protein